MKEEVFYRVVAGAAADAVAILRQIRTNTEKIMASQDEEAAVLVGIKDQLSKAAGEIVAKIDELTAALAAAGATSPAVDAATADLKVLAQSLDNIVADPPVV